VNGPRRSSVVAVPMNSRVGTRAGARRSGAETPVGRRAAGTRGPDDGRTPVTQGEDGLEPVPETEEALSFLGDPGLEQQVRTLAAKVREVVPETEGVSLSVREPAVTFTLAVSDTSLLPLDAVQYLDDGTCVAAVRDD